MNTYCQTAPNDPLHGPYHDQEYGFPMHDETILFERLVLEIMQAGLSWGLILRRREGLREAFFQYQFDRLIGINEDSLNFWLARPGIIRNRRKILAIGENARRFATLGSIAGWLNAHHPRRLPDWIGLLRKTLVFTGPEITNEFLMSLGYLPGAHNPDCPVGQQIIKQDKAPWLSSVKAGFHYDP